MPRKAAAVLEPTEATPAPVPVAPGPRATIEISNPATGEFLGSVQVSTPEEVQQAVAKARIAQQSWAAISPYERGRRILKLRDQVRDHMEELIDLIVRENGKSRQDALLAEILVFLDLATYFAKRAHKFLKPQRISMHLLKIKSSYVHFVPRGVVGIISPWNFPFNIPCGQVIMALVAGNGVVLKPSEWTPLIAQKFKELYDASGMPKDLLQVVQGYGDTGAQLIESGVNYVLFTGSTKIGKVVGAAAASKLIPCSLELGGKAPFIVCDDADLERAANAVIWGKFVNSGQICVAVERVYVTEKNHDTFVSKVIEKVSKLKQGNGLDPQTEVGAMCFPKQMDTVERLVKDSVERGAKVEIGGHRLPGPGRFFQPTVLSGVTADMPVVKEEIFGPILPIVKVANEEEAIKWANDSHLGLAGYVFTKDTAKGRRIAERIEAGSVEVNDVLMSYGIPEVPFGGVKQSGIGHTHGVKGLRDLCQRRHINYSLIPVTAREPLWYPYTPAVYNGVTKLVKVLFGFVFK